MYLKKLLCCLGMLVTLTTTAQSRDTLKVAYITAPPFIIEGDQHLEGINVWLWERVAKDLDLEYQILPMPFSGMLEALSDGRIDVSINPLTITSERNKYIDFTDSFYASNSTVAVAKRSGLQKFFQFVKGFFNANFIKGFLLLLLIIAIFGILGWYFERRKNPSHFRDGPRGLWDGIWWSAVTLSTVGYGDKSPQSKGGKITALVLMFGGLLFISGLTASIASSLTVDQISSNPDSFNDFKERAVGCVNNTSSNTFLKERFFKDIKDYSNVREGLEALKKHDIDAFIYDEPILKYRIKQDVDLKNIELLPMKFDVQFYAFGLAKGNSELEKRISQKILEIVETQEWEIILNEFGLTEI